MKNENMLKEIVDLYYSDYLEKKDLPFVVKNSIPIIWFGDINNYFESKTKIITVSINPSLAEFSEKRFNIKATHYDELKETMSDYFIYNPYIKWFNQYEKILNIINASYYGDLKNTSIHIDIYSALATNPTWSSLSTIEKNQIKNLDLFKKLLDFLNPDIILFSANKQVFDEVFYKYSLIKENKIGNVGFIHLYQYNKKIIIYGRNFNGTPFGGMHIADISKVLKEYNL